MAPPRDRPIHTRFTDPDATDSDTDSNLDSLERCQPKRFSETIVIPQSIPSQSQSQNQNPEFQNPSQRRQPSSKYRGVHLRKSGDWAAQIRDRGDRFWLGTFKSEEDAHQAYEDERDRIKKEKAQIAQGKKTQLYQKGEERREGAAAIRIKKGEEKAEKEVTNAVVSPPVKKRKRTKKGKEKVEKEVTTALVSPLVRKRKMTEKGEEKAEKEMTTVVVSPPVQKRKRTKKGEDKAEKEVTTAVVSTPVKKRKRTKKGEEKAEKEVTTAVVSPPVKKRKRTVSRSPVHPQSFVSKEKQRNDIPSDNPTATADIRTGSTSPVHNNGARPSGFWEDLSLSS